MLGPAGEYANFGSENPTLTRNITLYCQSFKTGAVHEEACVGNPVTRHPGSLRTCPAGQVVTGIHGHHGAWVDALGLTCGPGPMLAVAANDQSFCARYAGLAASSGARSQAENCGFNSPPGRWSTDNAFHLNWCLDQFRGAGGDPPS